MDLDLNPKMRYAPVQALRSGIADGKHGLALVPKAITTIIETEAWREFVVEETGELIRYERFCDFVTTKPLEGVGTDVETLRRLCRDDMAALDALDRATANPNHRPDKSLESNDLSPTPQENTTPGTLRRLRKDAPDLHQRVLGGELSPNAAAIEAGFRPRRVSVRTDDVGSAARTLARAFGDSLPDLIDALEGMA